MENLSCDLDRIWCWITDYEVFRITKYVSYTKIVRSLFFVRIVPNSGLQRSQIRKVPLYQLQTAVG